MGNVCSPEDAINNSQTGTCLPQNKQSKQNKKIGGCLIIKIKKSNVNMKTLSDILMEKTGQSSLAGFIMILKYKDQFYELDSLKDSLDSVLRGKAPTNTKLKKQTQKDGAGNDLLQDDQFKFNCNDIQAKDIISIQIIKPVKKQSDGNDSIKELSDYQSDYQHSAQEQDESKPMIIAQCNLQILWLLKNKDLSHWIKLYAENHQEQLQGQDAKIQSIGQIKIKTCFFKNKTFAQNEVSNTHQSLSQDKVKESDVPESFQTDQSQLNQSHQNYINSRSTSFAGNRDSMMGNSVLDGNALRNVDSLQQSLCISMNESEMNEYDHDDHMDKQMTKFVNQTSPQNRRESAGSNHIRCNTQQKIQFFQLQNNLTKTEKRLTSQTRMSSNSEEEEENEGGQESRSLKVDSKEFNFNLKCEISSHLIDDDKSLKSNEFNFRSRANSHISQVIESDKSDSDDSLKFIKQQSRKMERMIQKQKTHDSFQLDSLLMKSQKKDRLDLLDGIQIQAKDIAEGELNVDIPRVQLSPTKKMVTM